MTFVKMTSLQLSCGFLIVKRIRILSTEKAPIISPMSSDKTSTRSKFPFSCSPFSLILNGRKLCRSDPSNRICIGFRRQTLCCPLANLIPNSFFRITMSKRTPTKLHSRKSSEYLVHQLFISIRPNLFCLKKMKLSPMSVIM